MALRRVAQKNYTGCFVAAVAMLLGKDYDETFKILHPGKDPNTEPSHGFENLSVLNAAFDVLRRAGIKGKESKLRRFRSYAKRDKHALLIIRWNTRFPVMCHTIVYDGEDHKFLDPSGGQEVSQYAMKSLERQLDSAIMIDSIPKETPNDLPRSAVANRGEG